MPSNSERLARIEAILQGMKENLDRYMVYQEQLDSINSDTRDRVLAIENKSKGGLFVASVIGALVGFLSSFFKG